MYAGGQAKTRVDYIAVSQHVWSKGGGSVARGPQFKRDVGIGRDDRKHRSHTSGDAL